MTIIYMQLNEKRNVHPNLVSPFCIYFPVFFNETLIHAGEITFSVQQTFVLRKYNILSAADICVEKVRAKMARQMSFLFLA